MPQNRPASYWNVVARTCAAQAYSFRGDSSGGVLLAAGKLVFFDNLWPGESMRRRERRVERFAERLDADGIGVLAAVTHPRAGADDGLSLAVVLDAVRGQEDGVAELWRRVGVEMRHAGDDGPG